MLSSKIAKAYRLLSPVLDPRLMWHGARNYPRFVRDLRSYRALCEKMHIDLSIELFPCLHERTIKSSFDPHYSYLAHWATQKLLNDRKSAGQPHVDVGSQITWVMAAAALQPVIFVDIRPFKSHLDNLTVKEGSVLAMPFAAESVQSLSCLHVAEHVGLGRYGDPLDPNGTTSAIKELSRIVARDGRLLFALPVGRPRTCFNAHRIHDPISIIDSFEAQDLKLNSFSAVNDHRAYIENADPREFRQEHYACGMFELLKK